MVCAVEFIGALGIITILSALLLPKIYEAISNARLNQTAAELQSTRTAVTEHYSKFGSLVSSNGTPLVFSGELSEFDKILLAEEIIDKPQ